MENMQSFKTNDNVTLTYFDSGAAEEGEDEKPWLILVSAPDASMGIISFCFVLLSICANNSYFKWRYGLVFEG